MAFVHIQKIDHLDLIPLPFQQAAAITEQLSFAIQDEKRGVRLAEIDLGIKAAFSCAAAAADQSIERPAVFSSVQPHADVLGKNAVLKRVFIPVFLVHGPRIAPFGGTVFLAPAVVAPG